MKNLELFNGKWRNTQNRENLYFLQNPSSRVQGNLSSIEAKLSASHKIELNNLKKQIKDAHKDLGIESSLEDSKVDDMLTLLQDRALGQKLDFGGAGYLHEFKKMSEVVKNTTAAIKLAKNKNFASFSDQDLVNLSNPWKNSEKLTSTGNPKLDRFARQLWRTAMTEWIINNLNI